ncbi:NAD(P)-dependent oxidoreductase [Nocardioides sambongensis]|uniref:NAD(P)-dependent oxidoreductase n=1 Tax=Nocardioides sambongensis TaxID=2589074 RepID=UPI001127CB0F|nr:NAD(P)-dependent oxidoreductase [Nocardioides sambongensis]
MTTVVGFVGLGNIGKPMALRLASQQQAADLDVWVYDVAPEPLEEARAAGAGVAAGVAAMAARSDVLCVMVRDDEQVREVLGEVLGVAGDRLTVLIHSTVAPSTPGELADTAATHGVTVLDAPVSGGAMGAADGSLALMVGGTAAGFAAAAPVLNVLGSKVVHAGPVGAGTRFKLARNMLHFISFTAATEAQRLAEAAGLDLRDLGDVVRHTDAITGGAGAIMHRDTTAPLDPDDFWYGVFDNVTSLGLKDLGFALELAEGLGVEVPLAELAVERLGPGLGLPQPAADAAAEAPDDHSADHSADHSDSDTHHHHGPADEEHG